MKSNTWAECFKTQENISYRFHILLKRILWNLWKFCTATEPRCRLRVIHTHVLWSISCRESMCFSYLFWIYWWSYVVLGTIRSIVIKQYADELKRLYALVPSNKCNSCYRQNPFYCFPTQREERKRRRESAST